MQQNTAQEAALYADYIASFSSGKGKASLDVPLLSRSTSVAAVQPPPHHKRRLATSRVGRKALDGVRARVHIIPALAHPPDEDDDADSTSPISASAFKFGAALYALKSPLPRCEVLEFTHVRGVPHLDTGELVFGLDEFLRHFHGDTMALATPHPTSTSQPLPPPVIRVCDYNPFKFQWKCTVKSGADDDDVSEPVHFVARLFSSFCDDDDDDDDDDGGSSGGRCLVEFQRRSGSCFTYNALFSLVARYLEKRRLCEPWNARTASRRRAQSMRRVCFRPFPSTISNAHNSRGQPTVTLANNK